MSRAPKPRLATGHRITLETDGAPASPGLGAADPVIGSDPAPRRRLLAPLLRAVVTYLLLLGLLAVTVYGILAATVLVVLPADQHKALVLRGAFPVGQAPAGDLAYVSSAPVGYDLDAKINQAITGVPDGAVVQILAGPTAKVATAASGALTVDSDPTDFRVDLPEPVVLTREYLAVCVSGACGPGDPIIVPQDNVVGGVKGYLSGNGLTAPRVPTT